MCIGVHSVYPTRVSATRNPATPRRRQLGKLVAGWGALVPAQSLEALPLHTKSGLHPVVSPRDGLWSRDVSAPNSSDYFVVDTPGADTRHVSTDLDDEADGGFFSVGRADAHADATIEGAHALDRVEDTVASQLEARRLEARAVRLRRLVGAILILPGAIVGFVGASDVDRVLTARRVAALQRPHLESRPGPTAWTAATVVEDSLPAPTALRPTIGADNVSTDRATNVKPAKKKRRKVTTTEQPAPVASSSEPELPPVIPYEAPFEAPSWALSE
jgi:hypothetical protein